MAPLTSTQMSESVTAAAGLNRTQAKRMIELIFKEIEAALARGDSVRITDFGTFEPRERAGRQGVNPRTREPIAIPASTGVGFRPSSRLRQRIAGVQGTAQWNEDEVGG